MPALPARATYLHGDDGVLDPRKNHTDTADDADGGHEADEPTSDEFALFKLEP